MTSSWSVITPASLLLQLALVVVALIPILIFLFTRRKPEPVRLAHQEETRRVDRRQEREAILEQLARKEIGQDEAERKLRELDNPVPAEMPPPPVQPNNRALGCGCGCLVVILLALLIAPLLFILLAHFGFNVAVFPH